MACPACRWEISTDGCIYTGMGEDPYECLPPKPEHTCTLEARVRFRICRQQRLFTVQQALPVILMINEGLITWEDAEASNAVPIGHTEEGVRKRLSELGYETRSLHH